MGFAQTVDSFVKLLEGAPQPTKDGTKKAHPAFLAPLKLQKRVNGEIKTLDFKMPAHVLKFATTKGPGAAATAAFMKAHVEHLKKVSAAFAALPVEDQKRLVTLAHATPKTTLAKALKASTPRGPLGITAEKLKAGLALAKSQKVNLEAAVW